MKKPWHIVIFLLACVAAGLGIGFAAQRVDVREWFASRKSVGEVIRDTITKKPDPITITLVGDIMLDRGVENSVNRNFGGDFDLFLSIVKPQLSKSDITFGNLEGPVGTKGPNVGSSYSFQMNPKILPALKNTGFDIVSFANNHVGDRSTAGFLDSLENLKSSTILFTGAGMNKNEASQPTIIEVRGKKIGFLGMTDVGPNWLAAKENSPGILLLSDPNIESIVRDAKAQVDFLIVTPHWGVEYVPATARQKEFARKFIDWGADSVIGTHPHVIETTEYYQGKFIAYSLGNFVFDQYFSDATLQGLMVTLSIAENGEVSVDQKIIELSKQYQPIEIREPTEADYITRGKVSSQACPNARDAEKNLWLSPVGPDLDIGNYVPRGLVPMQNRIDARGTATCLAADAADALIKMVETMEGLGMKPIMTSGFRDRATQQAVYDASKDTQEAVSNPGAGMYPSVAMAGHSEHQLGTAIDLKSGTLDALNYDQFYTSREYAWMTEHAADYGFVNSYQKGQEPITGYRAEAWHWRYVEAEHAKEIVKRGVTAYEYLKNLPQ